MPTLEVKVEIKLDGRPIPGFDPYLYRQVIDEVDAGTLVVPQQGVTLQDLDLGAIEILKFVAVSPDDSCNFYFGTSLAPVAADAHAVIRAGGILLAVNMEAASGADTNIMALHANANGVRCVRVGGGGS